MMKYVLTPASTQAPGLRSQDIAMLTVAVSAILAALAHCTFQVL